MFSKSITYKDLTLTAGMGGDVHIVVGSYDQKMKFADLVALIYPVLKSLDKKEA
jgi:hypothetical protein